MPLEKAAPGFPDPVPEVQIPLARAEEAGTSLGIDVTKLFLPEKLRIIRHDAFLALAHQEKQEDHFIFQRFLTSEQYEALLSLAERGEKISYHTERVRLSLEMAESDRKQELMDDIGTLFLLTIDSLVNRLATQLGDEYFVAITGQSKEKISLDVTEYVRLHGAEMIMLRRAVNQSPELHELARVGFDLIGIRLTALGFPEKAVASVIVGYRQTLRRVLKQG